MSSMCGPRLRDPQQECTEDIYESKVLHRMKLLSENLVTSSTASSHA